MSVENVDGLIFTDCVSQMGLWSRSAGAYRIATELRALGYNIQVVDFWSYIVGEDDSRLLNVILEKFVGPSTKFVAFSTTFMSSSFQMYYGVKNADGTVPGSRRSANVLEASTELLAGMRSKIKQLAPAADIIVAGSRVAMMDSSISDIRMIGYGEQQIKDYLRWKTGKDRLFTVPVDRNGKKLFNYNSKATGFDFANSGINWVEQDCVTANECLPIEISRGCIFSCSFCSYPLNGKKKIDYLKSTTVLREEFIRNYRDYGTTNYIFSDDTFNDTQEKMDWFLELTQSLPFQIRFSTYARLDILNAKRKQISQFKQMGAASVFFGIESLNYESARTIGKGCKTDAVIDTLYQCRSEWGSDVVSMGGVIAGLPHDTMETMTDWVGRLSHPDFPLHAFEINALFIKNPKSFVEGMFISELDRDQAKHGYVWADGGWTNTKTGTNFADCTKFAFDSMLAADRKRRIASSTFIVSSLMSQGVSTQDMIKYGRWGVLDERGIINKSYAQTTAYMGRILSL